MRLEIQVRPKNEARDEYSRLTALEVWGASKWTRQLAAEILEEMLDPHPPGTARRLVKRETALRWMCMQYAPHLVSLAADLGGYPELGLTLGEMIVEGKRLAEQQRRLKNRTA